MPSSGSTKQDERRVGCVSLAGDERELIAFSDVVGLVVVFPVTATAVLTRPQTGQFGAVLDAHLDGRL
jgi:hypothetical protein